MGRSRQGRGAGRGLRLKAASGVRDRGGIRDAAARVEVLGSRPDLGWALGSRLDPGCGTWPVVLGSKPVSGFGSQTHDPEVEAVAGGLGPDAGSRRWS